MADPELTGTHKGLSMARQQFEKLRAAKHAAAASAFEPRTTPADSAVRPVTDSAQAAASVDGCGIGPDWDAEPEQNDAPHIAEYTERCSDIGNGENLVERHGRDLRFVRKWGKWAHYDGRQWHAQSALPLDVAMRAAKEAASEAAQKFYDTPDEEKAEKKAAKYAFDWAKKSQNVTKLRAALEVAAANPAVAVEHTDLDADPMLLNVLNGTVDLRTGTLREHRREDLITKIAGAPYDPDATCPTWDAFVRRAMGGSEAMVGYLQRIFGYCLTGDTREHVLIMNYGGGRNGKSTFTKTTAKLLGEYATAAPRTLLFGSKGEHPTGVATLHNTRYAVCSEITEDATFDEGLLKDLTGGDAVSARRMHEDFWSFDPTHKLVISGNHKPRVRGTDDGVWRRIKLIPWLVKITDEELDTTLPAKLEAELPGILAWAVRGCLAWQRDGLQEPHEVTEATGDYREESDLLGRFLAESCVFESDARIARKALRVAYEEWCDELGATPVGAKKFAEGLRVRGAESAPVRVGARVMNGWAGVRIRSELEAARGV